MTEWNIRYMAAPIALAALCLQATAQDWPMWGRDATRNMVAQVKGLPLEIVPGQYAGDSEDIDIKTSTNVKWIAKLGSQSYGNPTVANGIVASFTAFFSIGVLLAPFQFVRGTKWPKQEPWFRGPDDFYVPLEELLPLREACGRIATESARACSYYSS